MSTKLEKALKGQVLENGWKIRGRKVKSSGATGGCHAVGFTAEHSDGRKAFVKVMDPTPDPTLEGREQLKELERRLAVFIYEGELMEKCLTRRIRRVVKAIGQGSIVVSGFPNEIHYLLLELADNDLRQHATQQEMLNAALNMRILHQVALAIENLHFNQIAHQDLKPSNVLMFDEETAKVGDLGHAHDRGSPRPGLSGIIAGDPAHAPLEQLYGYKLTEWTTRRLAADLYLLGSLTVFMFTDISLTAQIDGQLRPEHHWDVWADSYAEVLPYLREAWDAALEEFSERVEPCIRDELTVLTRYLTNPDPEKRGHPKNLAGSGSTYGVRRICSRIEVLAKTAERALLHKSAA